MELVKNIFFNTDKLVENSKIKISYTGKFFQDNSEKVSIHYGFGNNWDNLTSTQMVKTELGYQIEIEIGEVETFNFCFCISLAKYFSHNITIIAFALLEMFNSSILMFLSTINLYSLSLFFFKNSI